MENITLIAVSAACGLAVLLFLAAAGWRAVAGESKSLADPPPIPVGKVPVWFYQPSDLLGVGMIAGLFYALVMLGELFGGSKGTPSISAEGLLVSIGFQFFTAAIAYVIVMRRVNPVAWLGLAWKEWPFVILIAPVSVVSMWALFAGLQFSGYMDLMDKLGVEKVQDTVLILQREKDPLLLGLMAFAAVIVAPLCEEVVFRGYLYPATKRFAGPWVAALCSALVFSAVHGSIAALFPLFIFGLVLVAIYEFTGSIWAPIGVHFLFNGATVAIQILSRYADLPQTAVQ
jgi:membrane protease YdiL (CAAX protease family)